MDVSKQVEIKTYTGQKLSYFDLMHAIGCLELISTPLEANASLDLEVVDFGPLLIARRCNDASAIEDIQFKKHTLAFQLPTPDPQAMGAFLDLPAGDSYNPFQPAGAKARWLIPANTALYHIQVDARWLKQVLGQQAMHDYLELCKAPCRRAYDQPQLATASLAVQDALAAAYESKKNGKPLSLHQLESLISNIMLPCIMSDIEEIKASTRQKILSKALDFIRNHHKKPIRLTDMAAAVSTSVRNLQMIFKQELGVSPSKFIQQFRLHRFRHHLALSNSVTEAAYSSGFKHLGRLTEQYAKVFAKYPSEDLSIGSNVELDFGSQFIEQ